MKINTSQRWHASFPGGHVGLLLVAGIDNRKRKTPLDARKRELEASLREQYAGFSRADFLKLEVLAAYRDYYKSFGNTYHVQLQLESVATKNKPLPNVNPLVDANFVAELETLVLTAGHDADLLEEPVTIDASQGDETFTQMNGKTKTLKPNDMMMRDGQDVVCSIIYGQDARTPISETTTRALYVAYAPTGVPKETVEQQLTAITQNIQLVTADVRVELLEVITAENTAANDAQQTVGKAS
ncbi:MAG: phenylalanine--tRNA ligase beta subunit-related protein [Deinococcota bacterium]